MEATTRNKAPFTEIWETIGCETRHTYDPLIQSSALRPDGSREESYGIAQIFLPAHPDITRQQAQDPYFAAEFIAKNWSKHKEWWSCYRIIYGK